MSIVVFFATLVGCVAVDLQCPDAKPIAFYEFKDHLGHWYEAAKYPNENTTAVEKCCLGVLHFDRTVLRMPITYVLHDEPRESEVIISHIDSSKSGNITAKITHDGKTLFEYNALILAVDFIQYALVFNCYFDESLNSTKHMFWVLSRYRTLEGDAKTEVKNFMESSGFLDYDKLIWIDNSEEACRPINELNSV